MNIKRLFSSHIVGFRITTLTFLFATIWAMTQHFSYLYWLAALFMYFVYGCLGVVITYHRLHTHRSFRISKWKERLLSLCGALSATGSAIGWVSMHHAHHRHSDTELDPHSPANGLMSMLFLDYSRRGMRISAAKKMVQDPFHRAVHTYYNLILLTWALFLFLVGGSSAVLFIFMIPALFTAIGSNATNYGGHTFGYKNFDTKDLSVNNPLVALLSFGEGWHNNHHRYPTRSTYRCKWWEFDLSGVIIGLIRE